MGRVSSNATSGWQDLNNLHLLHRAKICVSVVVRSTIMPVIFRTLKPLAHVFCHLFRCARLLKEMCGSWTMNGFFSQGRSL